MIVAEFVDPTDETFSQELRSLVQRICDASEPEIRQHLPSLAERLELRVRPGKWVIPEIGATGASVSPGLVVMVVDPSRSEGVDTIIEHRLRHLLFHELHHQARGWVLRGGEAPSAFIDGVLSEGLATVFERDAAGSEPPWGDYTDDVEAWVKEVLALPPWANYRHWMHQHPDGRRYIGYRAGTYLVDHAIASSGRSAADLVHASTRELLEMSGWGAARLRTSRMMRPLVRLGQRMAAAPFER